MDAAILLVGFAVATVGQVVSLVVSVKSSRHLATLAIHSALAETPQEYAMLNKIAQRSPKKADQPAPPIPYGL